MQCEAHGLATANDGKCIVCRRDEPKEAAPPPPAPMSPMRVYIAIGLAFAIVAGAGFAYRASRASTSGRDGSTTAAGENGDVKVTIYTAPWCGYCKRAKAFFHDKGVAFEERDVEASRDNAIEARSLSGRGVVPVIDIDGEVLEGFNEQVTAEALARASKKKRHM